MNQENLCNEVIIQEDDNIIVTADKIVTKEIDVNGNTLVDDNGLMTVKNLVVNNKIIANEVDVTQKWQVATLLDSANYQVEISSWEEENNALVALYFPETLATTSSVSLKINDDELIPIKNTENTQLIGSDVSNKMVILRFYNGNFFAFTSSANNTSSGTFNILDAYPISSIYISTSNVNPSTFFGGTWVAWGTGRVPVGVNTSDSEFNAVEKTGGAKTVALTTGQMPAHAHSMGSAGAHNHYAHSIEVRGKIVGQASNNCGRLWNSTYDSEGWMFNGSEGAHAHSINNNGNNEAHNNLQPYITCYMWKRTA